MTKKNKKHIIILIISLILLLKNRTIYAASNYDFFGEATKWFSLGKITNILADKNNVAGQAINSILDIINVGGTAIFIIVTAYLGIKFMYGSVESKADVKENMITLLVASLFFFGWNTMINVLYPNNAFVLTQGTTDFSSIVNKVYTAFMYAGNFIAIGVIVYIGIRYLIAGASGRADMKAKSMQFMVGAVLAFCAINFLSYVSRVINSVIK
jgi:hypothetical protein